MIETLIILLVGGAFAKHQSDTWLSARRVIEARRKRPAPGLSSQAAQIKPLTPAQIALGKKPYLGPKRKRKVKIPKRHQPT